MIWLNDLIMVIGETVGEESLAFGFWTDPERKRAISGVSFPLSILTFEKFNLKLCF